VGSPAWRAFLAIALTHKPKKSTPEAPFEGPLAIPALPPATPNSAPAGAQLQANRIILRHAILFQEGSAELLVDESLPALNAVLALLNTHTDIQHLLIEGHTNHNGPADYNYALSERRAEAVVAWLVDHGIQPNRLLFKGYGFERPLVDANHPEESSLNRRVEFTVLRPDVWHNPTFKSIEVPADEEAAPSDK